MNAQAVICPHCNARRPDVPTGAAGKNLSPAEIRAMLVLQVPPQPRGGALSTLLLPHPSTTGTARAVELVLSLISLPLVLSGALAMSLSRASRARMQKVSGAGDEAGPVVLMILIGSGVLWTVLDLVFHATGATVAWTLGVTTAALIARAVIRARASDA
jgi:hypothetical protein